VDLTAAILQAKTGQTLHNASCRIQKLEILPVVDTPNFPLSSDLLHTIRFLYMGKPIDSKRWAFLYLETNKLEGEIELKPKKTIDEWHKLSR